MTDDDKLQEHVDAAAARGVRIVDVLGRLLSAKDIRDIATAHNVAHIRAGIDAVRELREFLTASNGPAHTFRMPPTSQTRVILLPDSGPTAAQRKQARQRQRKARKQNRG